MIDMEKVITGLEWILEDDRFGFGTNWTEDSEPKSDEERAGYNIQMAIAMLNEQEERLRKLQKDKDKLCLEVSEWKHKYHDRPLKEQDAVVKQWTKEIADMQLSHAPKDFHGFMSLDEYLENKYKKGIWDGLQIAWNIISEGR